jgi:hypothetical protein
MTDEGDTKVDFNREAADQLTRDVFTPALQRAVQQAREGDSGSLEMLHGAANAYQHLLVSLLGEAGAARMMREHAEHLDKLASQRRGEGQ